MNGLGAFEAIADLDVEFSSQAEWLEWVANDPGVEIRRELETALLAAWERAGSETYQTFGYCVVCERFATFRLDRKYSAASGPAWMPNWRERLACDECGINNRSRSIVTVLRTLSTDSRMWLHEQVTPMHDVLAARFPALIGSEFLGDGHDSGAVDERGRRHEDARASSFAEGDLDAVVSLDVLEHIPDFSRAFAEAARVLRVGGHFIWTAPFALDRQATTIRAVLRSDGSIEHLLPPEYHGDPLDADGGILCFQHFGWDVLDLMRELGFATSRVRLRWSHGLCNYGPPQVIVVGVKAG